MIRVQHLTKRYGTHLAVDDLNLSIERGKIYGFLGPNGAGKSTTMNIMTGCLSATEGTVTIDGFDIRLDPLNAKKRIGYLPEQPPLDLDLTPQEYLDLIAGLKGIPAPEAEEQIREIMGLTGLTEVRHRLIRNLSKGYQQRVGMAQAFLGDPEIVILDEPMNGLDPKQIAEIRDAIHRLGTKHTILISSHILGEIRMICDEIIILANGRLVIQDSMQNLMKLAPGGTLEEVFLSLVENGGGQATDESSL